MTKAAKIAISLPEDLLQGIDSRCKASGESRSAFLRRAVEVYLRRERERELEEQYVRGYQQFPETEEEIALATSMAHIALAENPWEEKQ